ncbi:DUF1266 domain-containing protein [Pontiellaceae bacterium B12227]|nr:DUF1266 domain-containing protein [Pontiellaceae bacterium B12227]
MNRLLYLLLVGGLAIGVQAEKRYYTKAQKQWGLAASAVLAQRNSRDLFSLRGVPDSEWEREKQIAFLAGNGWRVDSREELLETMGSVRDGGHRASFEEIEHQLNSWPKWFLKFRDTYFSEKAHSRSRVDFVKEHGDELDGVYLTGWDLGRLISLARWGVAAGYLEEDEAWEWIMPAAAEIQAAYSSWNDLGEAYLLGREFWSARAMQNDGYKFKRAVFWLRSNDHSPWMQFDWDLDLSGSLEPLPDEPDVPETEPYYEGARFGVFGEYRKVIDTLMALKDEGSELSQGMSYDKLGDYYKYGREGIKTDLNKALAFYERGAELGHAGSMVELGLAFYKGKGRTKDFPEALGFWTEAAEQGSVYGLANLGILYENGRGVEKDLVKALAFYEQAMEHGSRAGENSIAWMMYQNDELWEPDEAVRYAYKAVERRKIYAHYDTLVHVLIKAERWDEAWHALNAWEKLSMRMRNNYDALQIPHKFKRHRAAIRAGLDPSL